MSQPVLQGELTPARHYLEAILLAVAFAVAYTQSPLYFSNQNQYLLHAACAGYGHLANDWLATTRDPTPVFSALVAGAYSVNPWLLQPAFFVMLMGYFLAARWLVAALPGFPNTRAARITFAALFTLAHAAIVRWASVELIGVDYPWYLQAGVAAQYLVGPGIQPSAFGILLLVAVAAYANDYSPVLATALASSACLFHATYLLPSGLLILGLLVAVWAEKRNVHTLVWMVGISALLMSVPLAYALTLMNAAPSDKAEAMRILADVRIPHHCVASRWFDSLAALQLVWIALGWYFVRSHPLGLALFVAALGGVVFSVAQLVTGSHELALAFPWRLSVLLVPLATAVIFAKLLAWKPPGKVGERIALAGLLALVVGGIVVTACGLGYRMVDEHEIYDYIRATAKPEDVYLLPVQFPAVGNGRGAVSNTFSPPPRAKEGANQIPVDLQRFRLVTGARIYVDFKSVPYAPAEVLEWSRRNGVGRGTDLERYLDRTRPAPAVQRRGDHSRHFAANEAARGGLS